MITSDLKKDSSKLLIYEGQSHIMEPNELNFERFEIKNNQSIEKLSSQILSEIDCKLIFFK